MIVAMKKVSVIVQSKDADSAIARLRSLGLLHVEHEQPPKGSDINAIVDDIALIDEATTVLSETKFSHAPKTQEEREINDWRPLARHIIDLGKRFDQLEEFSLNLNNSISDWQDWGDFEPQEFTRLNEKNIFLRLYKIPLKELKNLPSSCIVKKISTKGGIVNCVLISRQNLEIPFKEIALPKISLNKMKARLSQDIRVLDTLKAEIRSQICYKQGLEQVKNSLEKKLEFHEVLRGMGASADVMYVTGFVPINAIEKLKHAAQQEQWGFMIKEPSAEDNVPTLLKNPRWIALIKPLLDLLGILPGYHELDVNLPLLAFFSIFFGILIGDAGYGLSYLLITLWLQKKKAGVINKNVFLLLYVLSSCAIVWGVLTGTFFGQSWLIKRGIRPLVPALNDPITMQAFCFFLGALHLSLAHSWRAVLKFPSLAALADLGWVCVLWASFFLARNLILGQTLPPFIGILIWCGIALVIFFTNPQKNIFKAIGNGLGSVSFGLNFMSTFTDVVSYVRLFAVGLAAVAIAETTNAMAANLGTGLVAIIAGILIVVVGHALNIVLGPIAVLVHGVRLNVLEFSGHASITWSGTAYKPFQITEGRENG